MPKIQNNIKGDYVSALVKIGGSFNVDSDPKLITGKSNREQKRAQSRELLDAKIAECN